MPNYSARWNLAGAVLTAGVIALASPALAHHVIDGAIPVTAAQGLLSGLGHPILGIDHLAAVVAVGLVAARREFGALLAVSYMLAMIAGAAVHAGGTTIAGAETLVAISVLALGIAVLLRAAIGVTAGAVLFIGGGLIHGYALGETITGAEPAPLYAYLLGLAIVQSVIALTAFAGARWLASASQDRTLLPMRIAAIAIIAVGMMELIADVARAAWG